MRRYRYENIWLHEWIFHWQCFHMNGFACIRTKSFYAVAQTPTSGIMKHRKREKLIQSTVFPLSPIVCSFASKRIFARCSKCVYATFDRLQCMLYAFHTIYLVKLSPQSRFSPFQWNWMGHRTFPLFCMLCCMCSWWIFLTLVCLSRVWQTFFLVFALRRQYDSIKILCSSSFQRFFFLELFPRKIY